MSTTAISTAPRAGRPRRMMTSIFAAALLLIVFAAPAAAQDGTVTVIHGVPGLTVDVYVNGDLTLEGFEPGTITDPIALPEGDYELEIRAAGESADADPAIAGSASLPAGANASIIAHLDEGGVPTLTVFVNDTDEIAAGDTRVTVRHTAAAPAVDVLAAGDVLVPSLANPDEATATVPAGTYEIAVAPAGTTDAVLGPADLDFAEGTAYFVYAIGSADEGTLDLLVQTISGLHSAPGSVPAGTGGLATDALPTWVLALSLSALVVAATSGVQLARARR